MIEKEAVSIKQANKVAEKLKAQFFVTSSLSGAGVEHLF
jgi:hypothetical protein